MSNPPPSLLLLPPPPVPLTSESLSAAYWPSFTAAIARLKLLPTSNRLTIVVPCPSVHARLRLPRSLIYAELQGLLAGLYSLVCIVCAQLGADVESNTPGSIDARVILLDYDTASQFAVEAEVDPLVAGPIVDLSVLAITRRRWSLIFSVDGEQGQKIFAQYIDLTSRQSPPVIGHMQIIAGGVILHREASVPATLQATFSHNVVAVGGTFDHLHAGHKLLLTATALLLQPATRATRSTSCNRRLIVGITGDELLKNKKYAEYLKSWKQRQEDVVDFLLSILLFTRSSTKDAIETTSIDEPIPNGRAVHTRLKACSITIECVEIQDPFGPTITDESVTALVVSGETRSGGQAVNDKRSENGWRGLEVFEIDVLDAADKSENGVIAGDFTSKISSSAIRQRKAEIGKSSL